MQPKIEGRFQAILRKSKKYKVEDLANLEAMQKIVKRVEKIEGNFRKYLAVVFGVFLALYFFYPDSDCLLKAPSANSNVFREPIDCGMCLGENFVPKISNISTYDFEMFYAQTSKPVVIKNATNGWSAVNVFSFNFFKDLYSNATSEKYDGDECQFFPYKTEFTSLKEALTMDPKRAKLMTGTLPWYIGWSNCNDEAGKILKTYYNRPYFLPKTSESMALNWIFMGGPGFGAHMHVDNIIYPSWQAQLKGRKLWKLAPPPECLYVCKKLEVIVEPEEIIVLDTNKWYHQTNVLPGDISITIGSEFD